MVGIGVVLFPLSEIATTERRTSFSSNSLLLANGSAGDTPFPSIRRDGQRIGLFEEEVSSGFISYDVVVFEIGKKNM